MDPTAATPPAAPAPEPGLFDTVLGLIGDVLYGIYWVFAQVISSVVWVFSSIKQGLREVWLFLGDILSPVLDPLGVAINDYLPVLGKYGPKLVEGLWTTIEIVSVSLAVGGLLAIPLALCRTSRIGLLKGFATTYIFFFRGTPLLAQLYLIYYGSGQFRPFFEQAGLWPVFREAYWCALIAFSMNTAAYTAEILRGGIQAIPVGEIEAARSLGMGRRLLMRRVILPGAYRIALPAYGNEIILMIKGSAIASIVTILDLMGQAKRAYSQSFSFAVYFYAALMYLVVTFILTRGWKRLEDWLNPQRRPPAYDGPPSAKP
ncbi:ABC transporter permease [Zavarzinia sp.]|uniref:ABC transporter permease n=1 Tax=Zavarzinia sp. TaxID=2027920 RepID=UPI003562D16D